MKIELLVIGKTDDKYLQIGIDKYLDRLKHYIKTKITVIPDIKKRANLSEGEIMKKEAELILKQIKHGDYVVLLDDKGKQFSSMEFSKQINTRSVSGIKTLKLVVGGAYGFHESVVAASKDKWSLSKMTFSHQMVRLIIVEQIYRAMTILKGEPYHHE